MYLLMDECSIKKLSNAELIEIKFNDVFCSWKLVCSTKRL